MDEVHERSMQSDFLLVLLKRLVAARQAQLSGVQPLKIVLMSATIDLERLAAYCWGCPTIRAQGRTFPVQQYFLEDVYEMTGYRLEADSPAAIRENGPSVLKRQSDKMTGASTPLNCHCYAICAQ
jgi:ATP-dependent RNA helicase DHX29